jgi:hypothetical protein
MHHALVLGQRSQERLANFPRKHLGFVSKSAPRLSPPLRILCITLLSRTVEMMREPAIGGDRLGQRYVFPMSLSYRKK